MLRKKRGLSAIATGILLLCAYAIWSWDRDWALLDKSASPETPTGHRQEVNNSQRGARGESPKWATSQEDRNKETRARAAARGHTSPTRQPDRAPLNRLEAADSRMKSKPRPQPPEQVTFTYSDGNRIGHVFLVEDELQVTLAQLKDGRIGEEERAFLESLIPDSTVVESLGNTGTLRSATLNQDNLEQVAAQLESDPRVRYVRPVFYATARAWEERSAASRLYLTRQLVVRPKDGTEPSVLAAKHGARVEEELSYWPGTYLLRVDGALESLRFAQALSKRNDIAVAMPDFARTMTKRFIPNDTLFSSQWHLQNTGQSAGTAGEDVNIVTAWDTTLGGGVVIGIIDDGLQGTHPDLQPN